MRYGLGQSLRNFLWRVSKLSKNFELLISYAHGNFEEENGLGSIKIIINFCINIIINAY
jgi:hypothetical protein